MGNQHYEYRGPMSRVFVDDRNYPSTGIYLTIDEWTDFSTGGRLKSNPNYIYDKKRCNWEFERIEGCPEIAGRFLDLPTASQGCIMKLAGFSMSIPEIIGYTNIFHKLKQIYPKIDPFRVIFHPKISTGMRGFKPKFSKQILEKSDEFISFQKILSRSVIWNWNVINQWMILVLVPIYGEQRVMRAVDIWVQNDYSSELEDFLTLVECLDEFDESYPIDWNLSVMTSDLCSRLLIPNRNKKDSLWTALKSNPDRHKY